MARNADTQNKTSSCRNNYENGYGGANSSESGGQNRGGQNSAKNKTTSKSANKISGTGGTDSTGSAGSRQ